LRIEKQEVRRQESGERGSSKLKGGSVEGVEGVKAVEVVEIVEIVEIVKALIRELEN
jgi:hypothetical protein